MDSESLYCHEISRRSVARAALHLGIDGMSQDSLDVLADVLQEYMGRIGKTMSYLVECSGRPSSHANALDAIQAIHMTTSPAAHQVHDKLVTDSNTNHHNSAMSSQRVAPWQDLAAFCFGPKWEGGEGVAGKQGPSTTDDGHGWKAPYLEEVPPFPIASEHTANPHRLKPHVGLSLHIADVEEDVHTDEIDDIPDAVFTDWGSVGLGKNAIIKEPAEDESKEEAKATTENDDKDEGPARKKQKIKEEQMKNGTFTRPPYIASFMPSLPLSMKAGRSIIEPPMAAVRPAPAEDMLSVRSSLVDLGQSSKYWGSGWDAKVPVGKGQEPAVASAVVAPLGRASNSRASRILEGSMDPL